MAYSPEFWMKIDERLLSGECPSDISKSLGGKPSKRQIERRIDGLGVKVKSDVKMSQNVANVLKLQHEIYLEQVPTLKKNLAGISPKDYREVVAFFKDWREVYFLRSEKSQAKNAQSKRTASVAEKLKDPRFLDLVSEKQRIQAKIDELGNENQSERL